MMSPKMSGSNCLTPGAHLADRLGFLVFHVQVVLNAGCCGSGQLGTKIVDAVSWVSPESLWGSLLFPWTGVSAGRGGWNTLGCEGD